MALPTAKPISMSQIAAELGVSVAGLSLAGSSVRGLAGISSGAISMSNLLGKANAFWTTLITVGKNSSGAYGYLNTSHGALNPTTLPNGAIMTGISESQGTTSIMVGRNFASYLNTNFKTFTIEGEGVTHSLASAWAYDSKFDWTLGSFTHTGYLTARVGQTLRLSFK